MISTPKNILAPTDFSEVSNTAVVYAAKLASAMNASLHLNHVMSDPVSGSWAVESAGMGHTLEQSAREGREKLAKLLTAEERGTLDVESYVGFGSPADQIVDYAEKHSIDLIVMGTHGRAGVEKMWLGSITEKVLRKAHCPVLVVRHW